MPLNYLATEALRVYDAIAGDGVRVELPARSGNRVTLAAAADDLAERLASIFLIGDDGRRPVHRSYGRFHDDPDFSGLIPFHEYFHAETGAGLGAAHQTGWTGLVALLLAGAQATSSTALRGAAR
jgi:hypothetical protein